MSGSVAIRLVLAALGLKLLVDQVRAYAAYRRERRRYPFRPDDRLWTQWEFAGLLTIGGLVLAMVAVFSDWPEPLFWTCFGIMMLGFMLLAITGNRIRHRKDAE